MRSATSARSLALPLAALALLSGCAAQAQSGAASSASDPRVGLRAGWQDAGVAARNLELVGHADRPEGFFSLENLGAYELWNSDLAFRGNLLFQGSFNGLQIHDISDPRNPRLITSLICPGGQGDPSIYGNLLFMSVEETRGRLDCGGQGVTAEVSPERFRGVRIFDISDVRAPRQVAAVQSCRGSHTHTLVTDPNDRQNVYLYISGTSVSRAASELPGCSDAEQNASDPNSPYWSIDVVRVPLAAPQQARVIGSPRVFANAQTGEIAGLFRGGPQGPGSQTAAETDQCHDITTYPAIGLAAGACSGNGILLDIRDPANPRRIEEVSDPNFAYWHSATFNNDGTKVIFTDEWGGGTQARCRAEDPRTWGANAIYDYVGGELRFASHFKLPAPQSATENCVAHNGSLVPVPGRDIKVQGWYQGGTSVWDFTDSANPVEIAFFDRGPINGQELNVGGHWSAYWYNGQIYASEMGRGLDVLELRTSEYLTQNELEAAKLVRYETFNAQMQPKVTWPAVPVVARAYLDGLRRGNVIPAALATQVERAIGGTAAQRTAAASAVEAAATGANASRMRGLAETLRGIN